jgi:hypothetical protein
MHHSGWTLDRIPEAPGLQSTTSLALLAPKAVSSRTSTGLFGHARVSALADEKTAAGNTHAQPSGTLPIYVSSFTIYTYLMITILCPPTGVYARVCAAQMF